MHCIIYINVTAPFETFTKEKTPSSWPVVRFSYRAGYSALEAYNFIFTQNSLEVENKAVL